MAVYFISAFTCCTATASRGSRDTRRHESRVVLPLIFLVNWVVRAARRPCFCFCAVKATGLISSTTTVTGLLDSTHRQIVWCLAHQRDVDLALHELPARVVWLVKLPVVVELYDVGVILRRKLLNHIIYVLVLRGGGRSSG